jgi:hypothetical protein
MWTLRNRQRDIDERATTRHFRPDPNAEQLTGNVGYHRGTSAPAYFGGQPLDHLARQRLERRIRASYHTDENLP